MATLHCGGQPLPIGFTNQFLAHLQVATAARFGQGKGFFLTMTGENSDGTEITWSDWLHPGIPLSFHYDVSDDSDNRVAPVKLYPDEINAITRRWTSPTGCAATTGCGGRFPSRSDRQDRA